MGSPVDFAALARQFGGRSMLSSHEPTKPTPPSAQDYATLAQQFGGRSLIQTPPTGPQVALPKGTEWDDPLTMAVGFGKGLLGIDQAPGVTPSGFGAMLGAVVPVAKGLKALKTLTKQDMLARGADGFLSRAVEIDVPLSKLDGLEPVPEAGSYIKGRPILQPIEVAYDAANDKYMVYGGNHRIAQAKVNGQPTIRAFVEPDGGLVASNAKSKLSELRAIATGQGMVKK